MGAEKLDWEKILSIVTAGTAFVGIALTLMHMNLANKQALLDKRIDILSFVKSILNIYQNDRETLLKNEDGEPKIQKEMVFYSYLD